MPTDNTVISALETVVKICERTQLQLFDVDTDSVKWGAITALGFDYYLHVNQTGAIDAFFIFLRSLQYLPPGSHFRVGLRNSQKNFGVLLFHRLIIQLF